MFFFLIGIIQKLELGTHLLITHTETFISHKTAKFINVSYFTT